VFRDGLALLDNHVGHGSLRAIRVVVIQHQVKDD
jgi:hypothetical protein